MQTPGTTSQIIFPNNLKSFSGMLFDAAWCILLSLYVLAGINITPFHGDEAMLIYASKDYTTAFIDHQPGQLMTEPPYITDSDAHLRILNGSIIPYMIGLTLQLMGLQDERADSLWQWELAYDDNLALDKRPPQRVLEAARIPSALFFCLSIGILFTIAKQYSGRIAAYPASFLYTFNPVLLLNSRRAMHEGALLFFGLLVILLALLISQWGFSVKGLLIFSIVCGLTLTSKHSGMIYVVIGYAWIFTNRILHSKHYPRIMLQAGLLLLLTLGVFVALSPALWNNPPARLRNLLHVRGELLRSQVNAYQATSLPERITGIITEPYLDPPQTHEVEFWVFSERFTMEINYYGDSPWRGLVWHLIPGGLLTLLAGIGFIMILLRLPESTSIGLIIWLILAVASLLVNPLPWQRYYLSLYPLTSLLSALGMAGIYHQLKSAYSGET